MSAAVAIGGITPTKGLRRAPTVTLGELTPHIVWEITTAIEIQPIIAVEVTPTLVGEERGTPAALEKGESSFLPTKERSRWIDAKENELHFLVFVKKKRVN